MRKPRKGLSFKRRVALYGMPAWPAYVLPLNDPLYGPEARHHQILV
jgi:hypothetical protein